MEKAILKTLAYADIFDYPLKAWEIHKWLIGKKATLPQVEKTLLRKNLEFKIKSVEGLYYLRGRKKIVTNRLAREKQSAKLMRQAHFIGQFFKLVLGVKLVGVSGNLAVDNAGRFDDIDLFVITAKGKVWSCRAALLGILTLLDRRRSRNEQKETAAGKVCLNLLVEEDNLIQKNKDVYTAHEVLQMRVLWQKGNIYSRFLEENNWAFKFLPNWVGLHGRGPDKPFRHPHARNSKLAASHLRTVELSARGNVFTGFTYFESVSRWLQLRYMGRPSGKERIGEGELYFHPEDYRDRILTEFKKKCSKMGI